VISRFPNLRLAAAALSLLTLGALTAQAAVFKTELISATPAGTPGSGASTGTFGFSAEGRYMVFASAAGDLSPVDTNGVNDIYLRALTEHRSQLVSLGNPIFIGGERELGNGASRNPSISEDGQWIAYESAATNMIAGDGNGKTDVFARDLRGEAVAASISNGGALGDGDSTNPQISGDGSVVVFQSAATNLVTGDANGKLDIFARRLPFGPTVRVSTSSTNVEGNGDSKFPVVSGDGRFVAFQSDATNLASDDTNGRTDVFVKDLTTGEIQLVSRSSAIPDPDDPDPGELGDSESTLPGISADGTFVVFVSRAENLVGGDGNDKADIFIRELSSGITERVSVGAGDEEGEGDSGIVTGDPIQGRPTVSLRGRLVAFTSLAENLFPGDENQKADVFVHDREANSTERVSVSGGDSTGATISADGALVAFQSLATNFAGGDTNAASDVFVATIGTPRPANLPPTIVLNGDQSVEEDTQVTLDASGTTDPEGDSLTFSWRQVSGDHEVDLIDSNTARATFRAPLVESFDELVFEVSVSDGTNDPVTARVTITVTIAAPGEVTGNVSDNAGNPVRGATVQVVREDGARSAEVRTDGDGNYLVDDARAGESTITVRKEGFQPTSRSVTILSGRSRIEDFILSGRTATVRGRVQLSNGRPLVNATVSLLDGAGNVVGEDETNGDGFYRIRDLDRNEVSDIASIRIHHASAVEWNVSRVSIDSGRDNVLNFRYGHLIVTVDTKQQSLRRKLNGTHVQVIVGGNVVASNVADRNHRTLDFGDMPGITVRVRAFNQKLTGVRRQVSVRPGSEPTRVTVYLKRRGGI
jgi:Tol biopolymer transport system component